MIHCTSFCIYYSAIAVEGKTFYTFDNGKDVGEFAYTRWFDDNAVRVVLFTYLVECFLEVTL